MARRLPSLTALKAFEAAARHQSFTRAADELFVTQAAVSRQIRELEEALGRPLFHRLHRRVELTEAGATLAAATTHASRGSRRRCCASAAARPKACCRSVSSRRSPCNGCCRGSVASISVIPRSMSC